MATKKSLNSKSVNKLLQQTEWDLDALLPKFKSQEHNDYIAQIKAKTDALVAKKSLLTDVITVETFQQFVKSLDDLSFMLEKLSSHANFGFSKNVKDPQAKLYLSFVEELNADIANKLFFFELWFIKLPEQKAKQLIAASGEDSHAFERRYEHGKHVLSEAEEKIINLKDMTGCDAQVKLYSGVTSGWTFNFEKKKLSYSQISKFLQNADRKKRKAADALIEIKFREYEDILGDIYTSITKDFDLEQVKLRKYESPLSVRTSGEETSVAAVKALFDAVRNKRKIFQDFFKIKAKLLGLPKLESYDISAPLSKKPTAKLPYAKAMQQVLDTINTISPEYLKLVENMILQNHVDSVFHKNKRGGAYNSGLSHGLLPYVFMQYLGSRYDMYTIVHELGHSVHSMHMNKYSSFTADAPIGICESVSTFFEEVLFEQELNAASPQKKKELLAWKLTDLFGSVSNGAYVSYFETKAHELVAAGATHQDISKLWGEIKREQFGNSVNLKKKMMGWMGIPHIYEVPFYYYNYAVGNLIALLFLQQFKKDPVDFRRRFTQYLCVGGTAGTVETLKIMNINVEDAKTWEDAFKIIEDRVQMLKEII